MCYDKFKGEFSIVNFCKLSVVVYMVLFSINGEFVLLFTLDLKYTYCIRVFFTPLNFHELFWIREIKFVKCCRNVIAILVKTHGFVKI